MFINRHLLFLYVTLAASVGYFITAVSLGTPFSPSGLTPSFFPILVGAAAILFAVILILQARREAPAEAQAETAAPRSYTHLWVTLAIFVYIALFRTIGYFLSSWLFVLALILLFSAFEKLLQKALIAAVITGLAYVMFQELFGVRLPVIWG